MILTNNKDAAEWFKVMRVLGRHPHKGIFYKDELFTIRGWNMYMSPERAAQGILIFDTLPEKNEDAAGSEKYSDLTEHPAFSKMI